MDRPANRREWEALIAEYHTSGLSQKKFADQHKLPLSTLHYWLYSAGPRREENGKGFKKQGVQMLPIAIKADKAKIVRAEAQRGEIIEAQLDNKFTIRFATGTSPEYLAKLFSVLSRQC